MSRDRNLMQIYPILVPVRRRRQFEPAPPKLDPSFAESLLPVRRKTSRKHFHRLDTPDPFVSEAIEQIKHFMPIRGKRRKVIIPKPYTPFEMGPWPVQNINSDDRNMIDRRRDLNQPGSEVRDVKTKSRENGFMRTAVRLSMSFHFHLREGRLEFFMGVLNKVVISERFLLSAIFMVAQQHCIENLRKEAWSAFGCDLCAFVHSETTLISLVQQIFKKYFCAPF